MKEAVNKPIQKKTSFELTMKLEFVHFLKIVDIRIAACTLSLILAKIVAFPLTFRQFGELLGGLMDPKTNLGSSLVEFRLNRDRRLRPLEF